MNLEIDNSRPLSVPDRFESLERKTSDEQLNSIVVAVTDALEDIDDRYRQMTGSNRGSLVVMRGNSGAGKSTFLHTIGRYRTGVTSVSVPGNANVREYFANVKSQSPMTVYVLEEREAATSFSDEELEDWLHAINGFVRRENGVHAMVVWPCNTDELLDRVTNIAEKIGAEALLGTGSKYIKFNGPGKDQFRKIAETTVGVLNQGATFADLGLSEAVIDKLVDDSSTIGSFLGGLRDEIQKQEQYVQSLAIAEQARLWVIVIAGSEPNQEVAALTRGKYAAVDIERLMTATEANIVKELKNQPEKLGILATCLDAKILHLPVLTALSIARAFANEGLKARMKAMNLSLKPDNKKDALNRLLSTELASIFASESQGTLTTGKKLGSSSVEAFSKLADIAKNSDVLLNRAFAEALVDAKLIDKYLLESDFGAGLTRRTDIVAPTGSASIRIEMMWRTKTGRADIANYTLTKLANYGKALGYLQ